MFVILVPTNLKVSLHRNKPLRGVLWLKGE